MSPVMDPSASSSSHQDPLYVFLNDVNIRKLYHKVNNSCRGYHIASSKAWFLLKLAEEKIIPPHHRIKNKSNNVNSDEALKLMLGWMNIDKKKAVAEAQVAMNEMERDYRLLEALTPDHLHEALAAKVEARSLGFQAHYKAEKLKRFEHLVSKGRDTTQPPTHPPPPPKPKRRKWLKKSAYQRLTRQKNRQQISVCSL